MDDSTIIKIKNHLSDRLEEIKNGTYIPYYDRFKELPEFRGIDQKTFEIARREWYKQNLPKDKFKAPFIVVKKRIKRSFIKGYCWLVIGVIVTVIGFWTGAESSWSGGAETFLIMVGIILLVVGIISLLYNRFKKPE